MEKVKIGDTIKIIKMDGEPQYTDREGVVTHIDDSVKYMEPGEDALLFLKLIHI